MKKLIVLALFAFAVSNTAIAQIELKINPLGLLFNSPDIVAEYLVNEDIGVELGIGLVYGSYGNDIFQQDLTRSGFSLLVAAKYYFSPDDGCDKFYAGLYLRPRTISYNDDDNGGIDEGFKRSAIGVGLITGYKWVGARRITFEIGVGLGRALGKKNTYNDNTSTYDFPNFRFDGFGRLSVGYRFSDGS
jgi:hypothetical protein